MEYIPYRKRDGYRFVDDIWGPQLAAYGIGYARVDVRGSGDSEGVMTDEYSEAELDDGVQAIEWLSRQPWCTGAVGMRGISWGGINTLQVAARAPRALKAIMPMGCCDNRYTDDAHYVGGALGHTNYQWGILFKIVMAAPPDPEITGDGWEAAWRQRLAATPPILETWTRHQHFDAYWQRGSIVLDYGAIKCPAYIVDGWQDTYSNPVGHLLSNLKVPRKGLIGPWGHTYPGFAQPLGLDWAREEVRWWDHWLNGVDTGIMDEPEFRAFLPYATARESLPKPIPGRWIAEASWPPKTRELAYYLNEGALATTAGPHKELEYRALEVVGVTKPEWLNRLPIEQSADDRKSLTFDSAPLEADLEILGYPKVRLRICADAPVAKVAVRLTEVTPDGRSWLVTYCLRNLTHRDSDRAPSALTPGEFYAVELPLFMVAHRFKAGSRIRVAVSESLWPLVWPSPTVVTLRLTAGASALLLPVRAAEAHPAPMPIPLLEQPSTEAPASYEAAVPDASGRYRLALDQGTTSHELPGVGTTVLRETDEVVEIVRGDPASCRWAQHAKSGWKRGDWDCAVETSCEITSTATHFRVRESLRAYKDGAEIFARSSEVDVPRDLA
jgi:putative CocE/NonD family hydrolase